MSIYDQLTRDSMSFTDMSAAGQAADGSQTPREYTTAARGSKPTSMVGRVQEMSTEEMVKYGLKGSDTMFLLLFNSDPQLTVASQVSFADVNGVDWNMRVIKPSRPLDNQNRVYEAFGQIITSRN